MEKYDSNGFVYQTLVPFLRLLHCAVFSPLDDVWGSQAALYLCQLPPVRWEHSFMPPLLLEHKWPIGSRSSVSQLPPLWRTPGWTLQKGWDQHLKGCSHPLLHGSPVLYERPMGFGNKSCSKQQVRIFTNIFGQRLPLSIAANLCGAPGLFRQVSLN